MTLRVDLHCTAGCHPTSTGEIDKHPGGIAAYLTELRKIISEDREGDRRVISIGEIGLGEWTATDSIHAMLHMATHVYIC